MPNNYSPTVPTDRSGNLKTGYPPAKPSLQSTNRENGSTSSILLLTQDTTEIEIYAAGSTLGVAGKWLSRANIDGSVAGTSVITATGSANFDFIVANGWPMRYVVPVSTQSNYASMQGVNRAEGLFPGLALKTVANVGSVLTSEF